MEGLLARIADLTYDLVGILLPGLALLLLGAFQWEFYCGASGSTCTAPFRPQDLAFMEAHASATLLTVLVLSYMTGRTVLFLARNGLPLLNKVMFWIRKDKVVKCLEGRTRIRSLIRVLARLLFAGTPKELLVGHDAKLSDSPRGRAPGPHGPSYAFLVSSSSLLA